MAALSSLYPEIRQSAKGCPERTMDQAILRAARMFCARSWYVRRRVQVNTVIGQQYYVLSFSTTEEGIGVKHMQVDNSPAAPGMATDFDPRRGPGAAGGFVFEPPENLILDKPPSKVNVLILLVATQPKENATVIADEITQKYRECIGAGALSFILKMKDAPWTDVAESVRQATIFSAGITNAKAESMREFQTGNLRVMPAPFIIRGR